MATFEIPQTQHKLNKFAAEQWDKALAFLQGVCSLSRSDSEDVFQEAFIALYKKITDGELTLTSSLSTYFLGICKNKAHERLRANGRKELNIVDEFPLTTNGEFEDECIDRVLSLEADNEQIEARKNAIVCELVSELPEPCDKILWGFYRDGFSMKTLAQMYDYSGEGSVKVTKHRCTEKFKTRFLKISNRFFD